MIISNGGIERVLGPHLQKIYKSSSVGRGEAASTGDSVTISAAARLTQVARSAAMNLPAIRDDRVNALKGAISSGTYSVSDDSVAFSILGRRG